MDDDNEKLKNEIKKLHDLLDNKDIELKKVKSKENKEIIKYDFKSGERERGIGIKTSPYKFSLYSFNIKF